MSESKTIWDKTLDELDRVANNVSILLLLKDNKLAGRITVRRTQNATVHIVFIIYACSKLRQAHLRLQANNRVRLRQN